MAVGWLDWVAVGLCLGRVAWVWCGGSLGDYELTGLVV